MCPIQTVPFQLLDISSESTLQSLSHALSTMPIAYLLRSQRLYWNAILDCLTLLRLHLTAQRFL